jgi:hypothetical protein
MKSGIIFCSFLLLSLCSFAQEWSDDQLDEANTAADISYLTDTEKEVIQYINLCRLYPAAFADIEVKKYNGIPGIKDPSLKKYKASLLKDLAKRESCDVLEVDKALNDDAKCFSGELSRNNRVGHQRKECKQRQYAECLAFGNQTAKQIVLEWLIDSGVASLGHRKNCLNSRFGRTGISIATHREYGRCAVAEFWE